MRISGITLPDKKRLPIALTAVYGVGRVVALKVLRDSGVDENKKPSDLTQAEETAIRENIEKNYTVEGDLRRNISTNIKRLKDAKTYRGTRHAKRLPARGQRTKTNSRSVRGNVRKTMTSGRRKVEKK